MASFYSSLITLLILVAVLSTPAAAEDRKLRKSGKGHRKLEKSMNGAKCIKSTKDGCVGVVFGPLYGVQKGFQVSYGTGQKNFNSGDRKTRAIAVGTEWIAYGSVADPSTLTEEGEVNADTKFDNEAFYYSVQCKVLRGEIEDDGEFDLDGKKIPLVCHIDICYGVGFSENLVPDCLVLRGLTKGRLDAINDNNQNREEQLINVKDFRAAVIGGIGRFTGVVGDGEVMPSSNPNGQNPDNIPNGELGRSWRIDLNVGESPWHLKERVPMPPTLTWDNIPDP